jgi:hypothetical protein
MIHEKFSLVFPNTEIPLCHMYGNQVFDNPDAVAKRLCIEQITNRERVSGLCNLSYHKFVHGPQNKKIIKSFKKYVKINLVNPEIKDWTIPKKYNR